MSKQSIEELKERLNAIDIRLGKGDETFEWQTKLLYGIYFLLVANLIVAGI